MNAAMKRGFGPRGDAGFALVLTLSLLALLVLAVMALSLLVRVEGRMSITTAQQTRAQQHALLAMNLALGELQRHAGEDLRVTAMAGVTGIAAGAGNHTRHWCGVWEASGSFVAWLTSGAQAGTVAELAPGVEAVVLVGNGMAGGAGSVGASAAGAEHVIAGKVPIAVPNLSGAPASRAVVGAYAFLVLDEGVKISACARPEWRPVPGVAPRIHYGSAESSAGRLREALDESASRLAELVSFEQLTVLPAEPFPQRVLQDNFHHVTLAALSVRDGRYESGRVNINTTSSQVWRSLFETYNHVPGVTVLSANEMVAGGNGVAAGLAAANSGKPSNAPFLTVADFGASALLAEHLPEAVSAETFMAAIGPMLATRSDTFRIRAYGEAVNPLEPERVEAVAFCEAVVQRTMDNAPDGRGRRFIITYFRWLGRDDL